ncbi:alpha/beta hydrolase family protein [Streptomyces winkii]|uniref:alpha/beta hydrolase family protein n=1 Tax=Streptomyces winkii TaxID=3051178 RepID=UPI0028D75E8D|nr:acetylxylan esterase [Streptomyces sp. DSM 40971]
MARVAAGATRRTAAGQLASVLTAAVLLVTTAACSGEPPEQGPATSGPGASAERGVPRSQRGPYEVRTQTVSRDDADGAFSSGTVYYPADGGRDYGVIAASPGLGADESMVAPYGALLSSHGFVVITFNTRTREDSPAQRGRQLLRALDYATGRSAAKDRADSRRLGVLGHSMGGGGALFAAASNPDIKAAVPLTPYAGRGDWRRVKASTLVVGGSADETAPVADHAEVFYKGLTGAREKAYLELNGDHFAATPPDGLVSRQVVAWFRYFVDGDRKSAGTLCRLPRTERITESRSTCPFG